MLLDTYLIFLNLDERRKRRSRNQKHTPHICSHSQKPSHVLKSRAKVSVIIT